MKHSLLRQNASESHKSQVEAKETRTTTQEATDIMGNTKIGKKPKHHIHDPHDDRKEANKSGWSTPTRRTKHIKYHDQCSDYTVAPQMKAMTAPQIVMVNATCNTWKHITQAKTKSAKRKHAPWKSTEMTHKLNQTLVQTQTSRMSTSSRNYKKKHKMWYSSDQISSKKPLKNKNSCKSVKDLPLKYHTVWKLLHVS